MRARLTEGGDNRAELTGQEVWLTWEVYAATELALVLPINELVVLTIRQLGHSNNNPLMSQFTTAIARWKRVTVFCCLRDNNASM